GVRRPSAQTGGDFARAQAMTHRPKIIIKKTDRRLILSIAAGADRNYAAALITAVEHAQIIEAIRLGKMPPQHTKLGGEICIHGRAADHSAPAEKDWTRGCIALDNTDMQEVYEAAAIGTPVIIVE